MICSHLAPNCRPSSDERDSLPGPTDTVQPASAPGGGHGFWAGLFVRQLYSSLSMELITQVANDGTSIGRAGMDGSDFVSSYGGSIVVGKRARQYWK